MRRSHVTFTKHYWHGFLNRGHTQPDHTLCVKAGSGTTQQHTHTNTRTHTLSWETGSEDNTPLAWAAEKPASPSKSCQSCFMPTLIPKEHKREKKGACFLKAPPPLLIILIPHSCPHSWHSFRLYLAYVGIIVSVLLGTLGQFRKKKKEKPMLCHLRMFICSGNFSTLAGRNSELPLRLHKLFLCSRPYSIAFGPRPLNQRAKWGSTVRNSQPCHGPG